MSLIARLTRWLPGRQGSPENRLSAALEAFRDPAADTLDLIRRLVAAVRPANRRDTEAVERYGTVLARLEADGGLLLAFRGHVVRFLASRRLITFFTDSGILPGTGFSSEWWRILGDRILPEAPDERRLKDCLHVIFDHPDDWRWQEQVPPGHSQRLWALLLPADELRNLDWRGIVDQILDAVLLLAHRISGLGVEAELMRASPSFEDDLPRFVALSAEALDFVNALRAGLDDAANPAGDGSQLLVIADQCQGSLQGIRKRALTVGTSLQLSYLLARGEQCLERLRELVAILGVAHASTAPGSATAAWAEFARAAFLAENRRNSLGHYMAQLSRLLAVRVTENAARSGEHYICETVGDYRQMWRSAAGAGVLIAGMALLKIFVASLHAPLLVEAFLFSMVYGLGFVAHLPARHDHCHQAAGDDGADALPAYLGDVRPKTAGNRNSTAGRPGRRSLSQPAGGDHAGNVMMALPVAIAIGFWLGQPPATHADPAGEGRASDRRPQTRSAGRLPHAAVAGFYLFFSGIITGYFDNRASYSRDRRARRPPALVAAAGGRARAAGIGAYIQDHLGGIMGNFLFGCMLGRPASPASSSACRWTSGTSPSRRPTSATRLIGFDFALPLKAIVWAALGVALIGFANLAVSFALALRTALGARGVRFRHWGALLKAVWTRFCSTPRSFVLPPRGAANDGHG
jgi:site-specific recombinase